MTGELVLSLFPGIGILDRGFEEHGFCVVRGPDLLWGGDIKLFHPPGGVFDGVIGGPPCQSFSSLSGMTRANGRTPRWGNLIPEFQRVVIEAQPRWFVMENVVRAPLPCVHGYQVDPSILNNRWLGGIQSRKHRFSFGTRDGRKLHYRTVALMTAEWETRVLASGTIPKRLPGEGRDTLRKAPGRSWAGVRKSLALQGLPADLLEHIPFTCDGAQQAIGNAVAYPMALELARAVREALAK